MRTHLYVEPAGRFLHEAILEACNKFGSQTALVDLSALNANGAPRRISYSELGEAIVAAARGLAAAQMQPGERVGIFLPNSWEFCVACHAVTLAGGIPSPMNPSYREREVCYQLENSGAALLITNGPLISGITFSKLPELRTIYTTREQGGGSAPFAKLLGGKGGSLPKPTASPQEMLAALPYSSGTTGLPKGVRLSHSNLLTNVYQFLAPGEAATFTSDEKVLCFLPLYHIYGLNVLMNPTLIAGGTLVLMPRFDAAAVCKAITEEPITFLPMVPPCMNALSLAAERGEFTKSHGVRAAKSGAAPLAPELPTRFRSLTGIPVKQGYGMTEASPVTHCGFIEKELYKPDSIGMAMAQTDCRIVREDGSEAGAGESGELVMRGPQFMQGYWDAPEASAEVLRDGWYWSGDIVTRDAEGFYRVVDRRKEMIKYKGFPVAPAEVEAVLLEHPAVRECGVVGRPDAAAGEIPVAFVALREGFTTCKKLEEELCAFVADRLTRYKQPREVHFVEVVPKTASGKILRRELRQLIR